MENMTKMPSDWQQLLNSHFSLLEPMEIRKDRFTANLFTNGYLGLVHAIADIVKVAILALENQDYDSDRIPEPNVNISGVLELVLNMLPYEEAELLDILHRQHIDAGKGNAVQPVPAAEYPEPAYNYSTITVIGKKKKND